MTTLSVKDIQERYGVGEHTVLGWIKAGDLTAININRVLGRRPKYRITPEALEAFELLRTVQTAAPRKRARRKREEEISYY